MAIVVDGLDMPWSCMACPFKVYRDYDDVSVCVATDPNGVDCATPVELPTFKSRSSFCPLKELKERQKTGDSDPHERIIGSRSTC